MAEPVVEQALRDFEVTANNFAMRLIRMAEVRVAYVQIQQMSQSIRAAVQSGELSPEKGAQLANELRNQIMEMQRRRDFDLGRSLAASKKAQGLAFEAAIQKAVHKLGLAEKPLASLSGEQQRRVLAKVIEASGRSRGAVTAGIPRVRWAAPGGFG